MERDPDIVEGHGGIGADDAFWDGLDAGEFKISRCDSCKTWIWPAHWRCRECGGWDLEWVKVEPEGRIYSWTRTWYAFETSLERVDEIPFVTLLVEIPAAGGARVLGILRGDDSKLRIGASVRGAIEPPSVQSKGFSTVTWRIAD